MSYIAIGSIVFAFVVTFIAVSVACSYGESIRQEALDGDYRLCREIDSLAERIAELEAES